MSRRWGVRHVMGCAVCVTVWSAAVWAQSPASLKSVPVPKPPELDAYVRDERALIALGKALFWDMQVGSDSRVACASCHFHAGADHRLQNQLTTTKGAVALNWKLAEGDFPFGYNFMTAGHRAGSAGVFPQAFEGVGTEAEADRGADLSGDAYPNAHGLNLRQVTRRNTPTVINAVFNFRQFWDGRASNTFTGWTPFGEADPRANVLVDREDQLVATRVRIEHSSLASQAVGPPLDGGEMSYRGRSWPMLGRKLASARPLALQRVAADDSVLGAMANTAGRGLAPEHRYETLIRAAFQPAFWRSAARVDVDGRPLEGAAADARGGFSQLEYNFALFFGLAVQAYETTLVADDSPYDRYLDGNRQALTSLELTGLEMFQRRACASCHVDPELTLASYAGVVGNATYKGLGLDAGFFNTGVEPVDNDHGLGGQDGFGNPLSAGVRTTPNTAAFVRGLFKTPSLRNVEFTGPYFHSGSKATLEQIVDSYTAGGDYGSASLRRWGPDSRERVAMPAFMKSFTDDRVRFERAPFDHPELCVVVGHAVDDKGVTVGSKGAPKQAVDRWAAVPAVGARGNAAPLQTFEELLKNVGVDGSRTHHLADPCAIPGIE